ncbi:hypothetical protein EVAR_5504_1 [Eumeta japonica]|uniref:Uncharacterized protein n=1 Tax=Eumeta variegata TaxID=151549 RepID=A0A4C1T933_EUMVA|nr:hypothetical protein EVAR_5504_1 [Eumeta japonica]
MRKEPDTLFVREKKKEERRKKKQKKALDPNLKRKGLRVPVTDAIEPAGSGPLPSPAPAPAAAAGVQRSYDEEALERMRRQLDHDADAFLLNNILLSVQFFENYERSATRPSPVQPRPVMVLDKLPPPLPSRTARTESSK